MTTKDQRKRALDLMNAAQQAQDPRAALLDSIAHLIACIEQDGTSPETAEPDFPADSPVYEVWEFHGETPVRKIGSPSGNPFNTFGGAAALADRRAADPDWTRGKTDPSFRVVTVDITRTLVRTPTATIGRTS